MRASTVQELNLTTSAVPEDAAALILNAPQADLGAADIETLRSYLANGGRLLVTTNFLVETPMLDALLQEYGMSRQAGMLVETSAANYAYGYGGTYMLPVLRHNDVTAGVADGMYVFTPAGAGHHQRCGRPGHQRKRRKPAEPHRAALHHRCSLFDAGLRHRHRAAAGRKRPGRDL